jgi:hypothetical protein
LIGNDQSTQNKRTHVDPDIAALPQKRSKDQSKQPAQESVPKEEEEGRDDDNNHAERN